MNVYFKTSAVPINRYAQSVQDLNSSDLSVVKNAILRLADEAAEPKNRDEIIQAGAIPGIVPLLESGDVETACFAAGALSNLSPTPEARQQMVENGAVPRLVALLGSTDRDTVWYACAALRNLATTPEHALAIEKAGGIPKLRSLITGKEEVSQFAEGTVFNIYIAQRLPALVNLLTIGPDTYYAAFALLNLSKDPKSAMAIAAAAGGLSLFETLSQGAEPVRGYAKGILLRIRAAQQASTVGSNSQS